LKVGQVELNGMIHSEIYSRLQAGSQQFQIYLKFNVSDIIARDLSFPFVVAKSKAMVL